MPLPESWDEVLDECPPVLRFILSGRMFGWAVAAVFVTGFPAYLLTATQTVSVEFGTAMATSLGFFCGLLGGVSLGISGFMKSFYEEHLKDHDA